MDDWLATLIFVVVGLLVLAVGGGLWVLLSWFASHWRVPRPSDSTRCARCGYDVRGLDKATCPECGVDLRKAGVFGPGRPRRDLLGVVLGVVVVFVPLGLIPVHRWFTDGSRWYEGRSEVVSVGTEVSGYRHASVSVSGRAFRWAWEKGRAPSAEAGDMLIHLADGAGIRGYFLEIDTADFRVRQVHVFGRNGQNSTLASAAPLTGDYLLDLLGQAQPLADGEAVRAECDRLVSVMRWLSTQGAGEAGLELPAELRGTARARVYTPLGEAVSNTKEEMNQLMALGIGSVAGLALTVLVVLWVIRRAWVRWSRSKWPGEAASLAADGPGSCGP